MFLDDLNFNKMTFVFVFFIVCAAAQINHQVKNTRQCKAEGGMCKQTCVGNDVDTGPCCRKSYRCCQPCDDTQQCTAGGGMCKQKCVDDDVDTGPCCQNSYRCCQPCNVTCGGIFNEPSGTFTTRNYPSNYCNDHDCNYNILVNDGFKIMLNFTFFHTEGTGSDRIYDFVTVYDGEITAAALLGTLYGGPTEGIEFNSTSNKIILHFETDDSFTRPGFSVSYKTFQ